MAIDATEIAQVTALVSDLASRDVSGLSRDELLEAHDAVAKLGRLTGTLQARFAGEIARRSTPDSPGGGLARTAGYGDAGKMISRVTGGSLGDARRSMEAGEALAPVMPVAGGAGVDGDGGADGATDGERVAAAPRYPVVAQAALAGDLSVEAVGLISSGLNSVADRVTADHLRALECALVEKAKTQTAHEVRRMVARAIARADVKGHEERERRNYDARYLTWTEDHTGMVTFSGKLDAVTAAPIRNVIEQVVTHQFRKRRDQDPEHPDKRTVGQMRADALELICRHAAGCKETKTSGIRSTIVVRADARDLNSGTGLGSIDGTESLVSVGQLRRLAGDAGVVPEVLGGDSEVLDLGRVERFFTRAQRIALVERDGGCARCHAPPEHCEAHHINWWENGGLTDLSNGVMLCTRCHHDIHRYGWDIVVHGSRVEFIPPPEVDPLQQPRPGGARSIDIGDVGPPRDADGFEYVDDDFSIDAEAEAMVREWVHADALTR